MDGGLQEARLYWAGPWGGTGTGPDNAPSPGVWTCATNPARRPRSAPSDRASTTDRYDWRRPSSLAIASASPTPSAASPPGPLFPAAASARDSIFFRVGLTATDLLSAHAPDRPSSTPWAGAPSEQFPRWTNAVRCPTPPIGSGRPIRVSVDVAVSSPTVLRSNSPGLTVLALCGNPPGMFSASAKKSSYCVEI
eukprot:CAMPEP_0113561344 /NCGR_PEP_ID=MMETSP0015_2-20120614/19925_1 /TAXON_ID=2838 /ORGANISM="Odontella" /LENGTH=193 /DNA_ID=CAMNT_0000463131 /DNA_START=354 /DNA_END=937 /DNA_ORIENTATION=+ /assembly_acc=CAM_ASM_000160